jgi:hypothetical protein
MAQGFTRGVPIDTDPTLANNSNLLVPSQYAVVQYVANQLSTISAVTAVTASTPLASTGGATPNISITQASPTTDGYITAADYVTFSTAGGVSASDAIAYAIALG